MTNLKIGLTAIFCSLILHLLEIYQMIEISEKYLTFGYMKKIDALLEVLFIGKIFHIIFLTIGIVLIAKSLFKKNK